MLDKKILEYAVIGINAEIAKHEAVVMKGQKYLKQIENGEKPKTNKTSYEIHVTIRKKKEEIEKLLNERNEIQWQLDTEY